MVWNVPIPLGSQNATDGNVYDALAEIRTAVDAGGGGGGGGDAGVVDATPNTVPLRNAGGQVLSSSSLVEPLVPNAALTVEDFQTISSGGSFATPADVSTATSQAVVDAATAAEAMPRVKTFNERAQTIDLDSIVDPGVHAVSGVLSGVPSDIVAADDPSVLVEVFLVGSSSGVIGSLMQRLTFIVSGKTYARVRSSDETAWLDYRPAFA